MSKRKFNPKLIALRRDLAVDAAAFMSKLRQAGLFNTLGKMDAVCKQIGWEIAEKETQEGVMEP